jgi:hypothetical protein
MSDDHEKQNEGKPSGLDGDAVDHAKKMLLQGVGYKSPPVATQFKKGQSGNPGGRPRAPKADGLTLKDQPVLQAVLDRASQPVRMRDGETVREISGREAMIQSVFVAGLKGNARSQGLALDMMRQADLARAKERAERRELARKWKAIQRDKLDVAVAAGQSTRLILPHPDDIDLDDVEGYRVMSPFDEQDLLRLEQLMKVRDALIMQQVLDDRRQENTSDSRPVAVTRYPNRSGAMVAATLLDQMLPPRFRLEDAQLIGRWMAYDTWTIRRLLKETYAAWSTVAKAVKRGARLCDLDKMVRMLEAMAEMSLRSRAGRIDLAAICRGEIDDETAEMLDRN